MGPPAARPRRRQAGFVGRALFALFLAQVGLLLIGGAGPAAAQVTKVDTQVALVSTVNPSVFGQSVMFIATAVPADPLAGTPTGTFQFTVDGANLGDLIVLNGGQAAVSTLSLSVGTHSVSAVYSGDAAFNGSNGSLPGGQTVNKANSRVLLSTSANPSVFGQQVTFTAVIRPIAPGSGSPQAGTVQFRVDGADLGPPVAVSGGQATKWTTTLAVGSHTVSAVFSGDASFNGSTGAVAGGQSVNKADSITTLTSSDNPSKRDQSVTFTATVNPNPPGSGSPTGTVAFTIDGGSPLTVALDNRQASLSTAALSAGDHTIMAVYSGDAGFNTSSNTFTQTAQRLDTTTSLTSSVDPSRPHQNVVFTAVVSAVDPQAGTPGGSIQFLIDGVDMGSSALSGGQATLSTTDLSVGQHTVTAAYQGDDTFKGSGDALVQTVQTVGTTTGVASSTNPSAFHQQVTFTATVTADDPDVGTPEGMVQFTIDGVDQGSSTLSGGGATLSVVSLSVGDHRVRVEYEGDDTFAGSADTLTQSVISAETSTRLTSNHNP